MSRFERYLSDLGRGGFAWVGLALAARHAAAEPRPGRIRVAAAVWGPFVLSIVLARAIGRTRPCHDIPVAGGDCPDGPSLPSDQAAAALAGAVAVWRLAPRAGPAAAALALAASSARVRRRFHHPSDVAAGALLGTVGSLLLLLRAT